MTKICIQFHATEEEMCHFICEICKNISCTVLASTSFPFRIRSCSPESLSANNMQDIANIYFNIGNFNLLNTQTKMSFMDANPNILCLAVGHINKGGLEESCLSSTVNDVNVHSIWKKVISSLNKITYTGVQVYHPKTGIISPQKNFRFTKGAKSLYDSGIKMWTCAGPQGNEVILK